MKAIYVLFIALLFLIPVTFNNSQASLINERINTHIEIYALNLTLPEAWGIYGYYNYSLNGKNYSIPISNITDNYFIDLNISYEISVLNNITLYYNISLFAYKLQDYKALNSLFFKGKFNISTMQKEYNITLNASSIQFENINNFYYFWNTYSYKIIGTIIIIALFLFFISRLRRMR